MANTKLSHIQKAANKAYRDQFINRTGGYIFHFETLGVCVVIRRTGKVMAEFSVSIRAPAEQKYRKSVAEYYAFGRGFQPCRIGPRCDSENLEMEDLASNIAASVIY